MNLLVMKRMEKSDHFANGIEAQVPAEGSIPRGYCYLNIENTYS